MTLNIATACSTNPINHCCSSYPWSDLLQGRNVREQLPSLFALDALGATVSAWDRVTAVTLPVSHVLIVFLGPLTMLFLDSIPALSQFLSSPASPHPHARHHAISQGHSTISQHSATAGSSAGGTDHGGSSRTGLTGKLIAALSCMRYIMSRQKCCDGQ